MKSLEEALGASLTSEAYAVTDMSEDFKATRTGRWIKIIHYSHTAEFAKYYGFNSIEEVSKDLLALGWTSSPRQKLEELALTS